MFDLFVANQILRLAMLILLFGFVALLVFAGVQTLLNRQSMRHRLMSAGTASSNEMSFGSLRTDRVESAWLRLINSIEQRGLNLGDTKDAKLRQQLTAAGFPQHYAPRLYTLIRLVLVFLLPALALIYFWLVGSSPSIVRLYFTLVFAAAVGLYAPNIFVRVRASRRQRELVNGFPDALDLMLVCVEAGLGLEAAMARVGMEMTESHPLLAEQFGAVVLELRAGRSHADALRRMADRAAADDIRAFATLLVQSTKLGSSIAQTLRTYSAEMREKRKLRAEEKAHRLPVLISIPLVACMLPTMIGVLMLPAAIRVVRTIMPALTGG